jgi:hypothetical protein
LVARVFELEALHLLGECSTTSSGTLWLCYVTEKSSPSHFLASYYFYEESWFCIIAPYPVTSLKLLNGHDFTSILSDPSASVNMCSATRVDCVFHWKSDLVSRVPVVHTSDPSYLGGWDGEDYSSRPAQANSLWDPVSRKTRAKWT